MGLSRHRVGETWLRTAVFAWVVFSSHGCATVVGSWDYGLPKDNLPPEDRLWHIVFPLSVAAADECVFKREDTYGFFLEDAAEPMTGNTAQASQPHIRVRYVHAQLPAGKAGMAINDHIVAINGDPVTAQSAETVTNLIQRLTRAKIQPLTLRLLHGSSERELHLWAVHSCRMNIKLIKSPIVNALSDGSNIVVTSGLLEFVRSPDQLAWVLAHEVGHHVLEHAEKAKLQLMLNQFLTSTGAEKLQGMGQIDLERQADVFAADLVTRAGFDLREARRLLGWLDTVQGQSSSEDLRHSHPTNKERLDALDRMIRELDEKRQRGEGVTLRQ